MVIAKFDGEFSLGESTDKVSPAIKFTEVADVNVPTVAELVNETVPIDVPFL